MSPRTTLDDVLAFDPLAEAEKIAGQSYKENDDVAWLGMGLAQAHNRQKSEMLRERRDTTLSNELAYYFDVIADLGFLEIGRYPFAGRTYGDEKPFTETFFMFGHPQKGILLKFDTYRVTKVNGGNFYYNWRPSPAAEDDYWRALSSGHMMESGVWSGDHDCREAIQHKLRRLDNLGEFVAPWEERPFLWLVSYGEIDGLSHEAMSAFVKKRNEERLEAAPEWFRSIVMPARKY